MKSLISTVTMIAAVVAAAFGLIALRGDMLTSVTLQSYLHNRGFYALQDVVAWHSMYGWTMVGFTLFLLVSAVYTYRLVMFYTVRPLAK
jgi:hypothetical protein